jgi:hypothetical protein
VEINAPIHQEYGLLSGWHENTGKRNRYFSSPG